jgi:hypothetical protein
MKPSYMAGHLPLSPESRAKIDLDDRQNADEFKKFIALPHEAGHLIQRLNNDVLYDASISLEENKARPYFLKPHREEIDSDEYASNIYAEATNRGLIRGPEV